MALSWAGGSGPWPVIVGSGSGSGCRSGGVGLAVPEDQIERTIYDALITDADGKPAGIPDVVWQIASDFDLAPSNIKLAVTSQAATALDSSLGVRIFKAGMHFGIAMLTVAYARGHR